MTDPATIIAIIALVLWLLNLSLMVLLVWQQHQMRAEVRASTPVQLRHAVQSVQQQLSVWAALLGEGGAREIRGRLDAHEGQLIEHAQRISRLEEER